MEIITFSDAIAKSEKYTKRHLLLGNGFSISAKPDIFTYGSLFKQSGIENHPRLSKVFAALNTTDFEVVISILEQSATLTPIYSKDHIVAKASMIADANELKDILISTVANNHPAGPHSIEPEEFQSCREFLQFFLLGKKTGTVFSVNYDLLLYWTLMQDRDFSEVDGLRMRIDDGFGNDDDDPNADFVVWHGETRAHTPSVFYLHGALHLFDAKHNLQKYTWIRTDRRLVEQSRSAMDSGKFPLFVAEGTSEQKQEKIRHNAYLYQGLKTLFANANQTGCCFFVHGHSLDENDRHVFEKIGRGKCRKIFVSIYGGLDSDWNLKIVENLRRIQSLRSERYPLEFELYDAESAQIWDKYL